MALLFILEQPVNAVELFCSNNIKEKLEFVIEILSYNCWIILKKLVKKAYPLSFGRYRLFFRIQYITIKVFLI